MQKNITREAAGYLARAKRRRIWLKVVSALGCVVVFCTTYALILPAITMERTGCGLTEHTHTAGCYTKVTAVTRQEPVCSMESMDLHEHTEDCFDENGEPVCGYADFVIHRHDASCYGEDGRLWCPLPEIEAHTHSENCYPTHQTSEIHTHTDECYTAELGNRICTESTEAAHAHGAECYQETETLTCADPESDGHQHSDGCFDENGDLICTSEESDGHRHGPECYETTSELICTLSEEPHQHTDECYTQNKVLTCALSTEPEEEPAEVSAEAEPELVFLDYVLNPNMEMPVKNINGIDFIGVLRIPSLELELPVISQWSYPNLKSAPCRYAGSAYLNNMIICAHNYTSHFGNLKNLQEGDIVTFQDMDGNVFDYEVALLEALMPTDIEEMESGGWDLTLFTCTISGSYRVTVRCDLVTENGGKRS